jgi:hypothetical protein
MGLDWHDSFVQHHVLDVDVRQGCMPASEISELLETKVAAARRRQLT